MGQVETGDPCPFCKRPVAVCHEPVDSRFPEPARDAYACAQLETAPKCPKGEAADMRATQHGPRLGWNISRAVGHPEWAGDVPEGMDPRIALNRTRRKGPTHRDRDRLEKEFRR
jgi:hypothetical protein